MIDYIKLDITHVRKETLMSNPLIKWEEKHDPITGEIYTKFQIGYYKSLTFIVTSKQKILKGSLHIISNEIIKNERQNWDDFTLRDLVKVILWLKSTFGIDPKKSAIQNLEYGVNVAFWIDPTNFIIENVIVWNGRPHSKNFEYNNKGKYIEWNLSQYSIKLYNKGSQHYRSNYIIRFEKKVTKSEQLNKMKIFFLSDLMNIEKLENLKNDLLSNFDKLLVVDSLEANINESEKDLYLKGINPKVWESLKNKHRSQRSRLKNRFSQLIRRNGLDKFHSELRNRIDTKSTQLVECNVLTTPKRPILDEKDIDPNATFLPLDKESECNTDHLNDFYRIRCVPMKPKKYRKRNPESIPYSDKSEIKKPRNDESNPRNNLARRVIKQACAIRNSLFPNTPICLTIDEYLLLLPWVGTKFDVLSHINYLIRK